MRRSRIVKQETVPRKMLKRGSSEDELAIQNLIGNQESEQVYMTEHSYAEEEDNIEALEEEYEEDPVKEEYYEEETDALASGEPNLRTELAKLVKKTNASDAFTDNLLKLLRRSGHTDLPANKTTLVSKPKPKPVKLNESSILKSILENQNAIMNNQKLMTEQLKSLAKSQALQRAKLGALSESVDKILPLTPYSGGPGVQNDSSIRLSSIFPIQTSEEFDEFNQNLEDENFRVTILPELVKILTNANWLCMIIDDEITHEYNLNGTRSKKSLRGSKLCQLLDHHLKDNEYLQDYHIQGLIRNAHGRRNTKNHRERTKLRASGQFKEETRDDNHSDNSDTII
ncbi:hypothetical protein DMENIID0001_024350 [Sergentomyia squamirostris]